MTKVIITHNGATATLEDIECIPQGMHSYTPWVGILLGQVRYTLEDMGQGTGKLRTYKNHIPICAEQALYEMELGSDDTVYLTDRVL